MKKKIIIVISSLIILVGGIVVVKNLPRRDLPILFDDWKLLDDTNVKTVLTLEDTLDKNSIWCGTFQLIWNDLKNELAKQDIIFNPQLEVVDNLNKETFKESDISEKAYYKKYGIVTLELKKEIEDAIKRKFNETSDILDVFDFENANREDYFLYTMLKKEFKFTSKFDILENDKFGKYESIRYFGIDENSNSSLREQVIVLYYNSEDNFAIKLLTDSRDEIILVKSPKGNTFNEIYNNITKESSKYIGNRSMQSGELLKVPYLNINVFKEFQELENKLFNFANGKEYEIGKAIQTIKMELTESGGKVKSEAAMGVVETSTKNSLRNFYIDDEFALFLKESDKEVPYLAMKINDIQEFTK